MIQRVCYMAKIYRTQHRITFGRHIICKTCDEEKKPTIPRPVVFRHSHSGKYFVSSRCEIIDLV